MANFIEEFFYGNIEPQARSTKQSCSEVNRDLADIDKQAEDLFFRLVKQMAEREGVTENARWTIKWSGLLE